jgi:hypothetical protein
VAKEGVQGESPQIILRFAMDVFMSLIHLSRSYLMKASGNELREENAEEED